MVKSGANQQIGYILRSYPRLSQTFILNEILALEKAGVPLRIFALSRPQEALVQPQVAQIRAPVHYLAPGGPAGQALKTHAGVFLRHPAGYLRALFYSLSHRAIDQGYTSSSRMACFNTAVSFAALLRGLEAQGQAVSHLHAHFAHDPTFIAQMVSWMSGMPYSFTAHARDLFQVPQSVLAERIRDARFVITCCASNLAYLNQVAPAQQAKFSMIYHGVNVQAFCPAPLAAAHRERPLILTVGRLVEKKGFMDLLQALEQVRANALNRAPFECVIYGDGPLRPALNEWINAHGLADCVTLAGSTDQQRLIGVLQSATLFALTPAVLEDGDRDGIPNVLAEAMSVGLPVVTTAVGGIPELVTPGVNGLLYAPHDIQGIAGGILELLGSAAERAAFGQAARESVLQLFDDTRAAERLKALFAFLPKPVVTREYSRANGPI